VVLRIDGAALSLVFAQAAEKLIRCKDTWISRQDEAAAETVADHHDKLRHIQDALRTVGSKVHDVQRRLQAGEEARKEKEAEKNRQKTFGARLMSSVNWMASRLGGGSSGGGALRVSEANDGPGELSIDGTPRHSNDMVDISDIRISK